MIRSLAMCGVLAIAGVSAAAPSKVGVISARAQANDELRLEARAGLPDGPQFKSVYRERTRNGQLTVRWKVQIEDFPPGAEVPVALNGTFVGNMFANNLGRAEIQFRTIVDDPGDGEPLPEGFPRLVAGDTITVGDLSAQYLPR